MTWHRLIAAAMWAALICFDFTAFGPFMISQPLVCGPLFGWLMGQVSVGIIIGGIVQLLWMDLSPVGVGIPYDATATTLLAVYWATLQPHSALSQVILALAMAVPMGFVFRWLDQRARRINTRLMHQVEAFSDDKLPVGLWLGILGGISWSWIRYFVTYGVLFGLGEFLWRYWAYSPKMTMVDRGLTMASLLLPVAGLGVVLELFLSEEPKGRS
jgi:mannose/fructose/N-acetylgalactosamine-specific phosphotransferase system component IIC